MDRVQNFSDASEDEDDKVSSRVEHYFPRDQYSISDSEKRVTRFLFNVNFIYLFIYFLRLGPC